MSLSLCSGCYCCVVTLHKLNFWDKGHKPLSQISVPGIISITCLGLSEYAVCIYNATLKGLFFNLIKAL